MFPTLSDPDEQTKLTQSHFKVKQFLVSLLGPRAAGRSIRDSVLGGQAHKATRLEGASFGVFRFLLVSSSSSRNSMAHVGSDRQCPKLFTLRDSPLSRFVAMPSTSEGLP